MLLVLLVVMGVGEVVVEEGGLKGACGVNGSGGGPS